MSMGQQHPRRHSKRHTCRAPTPTLIAPHRIIHQPTRPHYNTCNHATTNAQRLEQGQFADCVGDAAAQLVAVQTPVYVVNRNKRRVSMDQQYPRRHSKRHTCHAPTRHHSSPRTRIAHEPTRPHYNTCNHATTNAHRHELGQVANCVGDAATQLVAAQIPVCVVHRAKHGMRTVSNTQDNTHSATPTMHATQQPTHNATSWFRLPIVSGMLPLSWLPPRPLWTW